MRKIIIGIISIMFLISCEGILWEGEEIDKKAKENKGNITINISYNN